MTSKVKIVFFGSSKFSLFCLDELKKRNLLPNLIITTPDQPTGRGLKLTPTVVKTWAAENSIKCLTPESLREHDILTQLNPEVNNLFLVASYGKIIPKDIVTLPQYGTLNIHPSLLPKYRGPSPLQEQILNNEKSVGVTLMLMDEKVDHGPIIVQEKVEITDWPKLEELKAMTAKVGIKLFAENLDAWIKGEIKGQEQNHDEATFTKKIEKADGLIDLENDNTYQNFLKIQAYSLWPQAYFFKSKGDQKIRVIVKEAEFENNTLVIKRVLPEGKKEMSYEDFLRGLKS